MKNREQWATPFNLLSPLPKRNIEKPWRGVGAREVLLFLSGAFFLATALAALLCPLPTGSGSRETAIWRLWAEPSFRSRNHTAPQALAPQTSLVYLT